MCEIKLLVIEDAESDSSSYQGTVDRLNDQQRSIELIIAKTVQEAFQQNLNEIDGVVVDLALDGDLNAGTGFVKEIYERGIRLPITILTGTPDSADKQYSYVRILKKGEVNFEKIIDEMIEIKKTGIGRILGNKGKIENQLRNIFDHIIVDQMDAWRKYAKSDSNKSERGLLRLILNNILGIAEFREDSAFPEEYYVYPQAEESLDVGMIVSSIEEKGEFVILTPACDLAPRGPIFDTGKKNEKDGKRPPNLNNVGRPVNTDCIVLAAIESTNLIIPPIPATEKISGGISKEISKKLNNNSNLYHHWLPPSGSFHGGFINFRRLLTVSISQMNKDYKQTLVQISQPFMKDIVSRFSAYYGRQGQPEVFLDHLLEDVARGSIKSTGNLGK